MDDPAELSLPHHSSYLASMGILPKVGKLPPFNPIFHQRVLNHFYEAIFREDSLTCLSFAYIFHLTIVTASSYSFDNTSSYSSYIIISIRYRYRVGEITTQPLAINSSNPPPHQRRG
jgi:hypothetical protein